MIVQTVRIPYKLGETIRIKPIFDTHFGNKYSDKAAFIRFVNDPEAYFFCGGDYLDSIITKDIKRYTKHTDDTEGDDIIDEQIETGYDLMKHNKGRILGWGTGNHETKVKKYHGTDPAKRLANMFECPQLGYSGLLRLILNENGARIRTVTIRYHHGWGGGSRTQGADLTKYSKDITHWEADVFLYGHVHKKQTDDIPRLGLSGSHKLISKDIQIGLCGSFLKTYSDTADATYSEEKGYPPIAVGGITLHIKPEQTWCSCWLSKR